MIILTFVMIFSSCNNNEIKNISTEEYIDDLEKMGLLAENKSVDYYFYYPENWAIHRNDAMIIVSGYDDDILETDKTTDSGEPLAYLTRPNISAVTFILLDQYATIEDYWNDFVAPSYEGLYENIEFVEDLTVDEKPAKKYTFTSDFSGMDMRYTQIIFFNKNQVYSLTYTSTAEKHQTYMNVLNAVANSFKFK